MEGDHSGDYSEDHWLQSKKCSLVFCCFFFFFFDGGGSGLICFFGLLGFLDFLKN